MVAKICETYIEIGVALLQKAKENNILPSVFELSYFLFERFDSSVNTGHC